MLIAAMTALMMKYCEGKDVDGFITGTVFVQAMIYSGYIIVVTMGLIHDTYECPLV